MERGKKKGNPWREGKLNRRRASISLKSPMPYLSPTVTLNLHCEHFWTFIVIVTFDLLHMLLRMRTNRQTRTIIYRCLTLQFLRRSKLFNPPPGKSTMGSTKFTQVDAGRGQNVTFDPLYLENFLELECHRC